MLLLVRQRVAISAGRALLVMGGYGNSIAVTLTEILDQTDRVGAKSPIFVLFSLFATQP